MIMTLIEIKTLDIDFLSLFLSLWKRICLQLILKNIKTEPLPQENINFLGVVKEQNSPSFGAKKAIDMAELQSYSLVYFYLFVKFT